MVILFSQSFFSLKFYSLQLLIIERQKHREIYVCYVFMCVCARALVHVILGVLAGLCICVCTCACWCVCVLCVHMFLYLCMRSVNVHTCQSQRLTSDLPLSLTLLLYSRQGLSVNL